ncbi:MAG: hypothetical protein ACXV6K_03690 [Halobacteriota archaeon]
MANINMGFFLGKRDRELAKYVAKCYYGLDDGEYDVEVVEHFNCKVPNVGFINDIKKELQVWWPRNIGTKSKVARLSESDFVHYINELRAKNGSPPLSSGGSLHKKWMECMASNEPHVYLVAIRGNKTRLVLVNTKIHAHSRS